MFMYLSRYYFITPLHIRVHLSAGFVRENGIVTGQNFSRAAGGTMGNIRIGQRQQLLRTAA